MASGCLCMEWFHQCPGFLRRQQQCTGQFIMSEKSRPKTKTFFLNTNFIEKRTVCMVCRTMRVTWWNPNPTTTAPVPRPNRRSQRTLSSCVGCEHTPALCPNFAGAPLELMPTTQMGKMGVINKSPSQGLVGNAPSQSPKQAIDRAVRPALYSCISKPQRSLFWGG